MKNLESMSVHEMGTQELRKVDGGWWNVAARIAIAAGVLRAAEDFWNGFKEGFSENIDPEIADVVNK